MILSGLKQRKPSVHLSQFIGNLIKQEKVELPHVYIMYHFQNSFRKSFHVIITMIMGDRQKQGSTEVKRFSQGHAASNYYEIN